MELLQIHPIVCAAYPGTTPHVVEQKIIFGTEGCAVTGEKSEGLESAWIDPVFPPSIITS
jgi:hypothetical protein